LRLETAETVTDRVAVLVTGGLSESVTVTVTVDTPATDGVPARVPVEPSVSPTGRPAADQVYGLVPPLASSVAE
jgi:hypothetical protein